MLGNERVQDGVPDAGPGGDGPAGPTGPGGPPGSPPGRKPSALRWVPAIAVVALATGVVGWAALGGVDDPPGRGGACPTGRPSAAVDTWTEEVTSTGMPGGPPFAVYHLDVEVVVTNEASAPIVVRSVEVPLVAPPGQPPGVGFPSEVAEVAPGGTTTVEVPMDVVIEGTPMPPTPDSSVRLSAEWASDELVSCPI